VSLHHNLWANNNSRVPQVISEHGTFEVDLINNVVYNWGPYDDQKFGENALGSYLRSNNSSSLKMNVVGNYYKVGPDTVMPPNWPDGSVYAGPLCAYRASTSAYLEVYWGRADGNDDWSANWLRTVTESKALKPKFLGSPAERTGLLFAWTDHVGISPQTPADAYNSVLGISGAGNGAGPSLFNRDATDTRVFNTVENWDWSDGIKYAIPPGEIPTN
jgi:hypothetical protein